MSLMIRLLALIPLGTQHRLENPGKVTLEMIEVQPGSYLGEDDIVRFEGEYGPADRGAELLHALLAFDEEFAVVLEEDRALQPIDQEREAL